MSLRSKACIATLVLGLGSCSGGTILYNQDQRHIGQGMMGHYARAQILASEEERQELDAYLNPSMTVMQKAGSGLFIMGYVFLGSAALLRRREDEE